MRLHVLRMLSLGFLARRALSLQVTRVVASSSGKRGIQFGRVARALCVVKVPLEAVDSLPSFVTVVDEDDLPPMRTLADIESRELEEMEGGENDDEDAEEGEEDDEDEDEEDEEECGDLPLLSTPAGSRAVPAAVAKKPKRVQQKPHVPYPMNESDLEETFVRGGGPGGQAINKTRSMVQLIHVPTGLRVHCQEARDLTTNRRIARKLMRDKLDLLENGNQSRLGKQYDKIRKQKAKKRSKSKAKYAKDVPPGSAEVPPAPVQA